MVEGANPEIMGGNSMRVPVDAILPETRKGADKLGRQASHLAPRPQRLFRLEPASATGEINHLCRAIVPAGMKRKTAPVVGKMAHVRLLLAQPAGKYARIGAADRARIQPKRAIHMLAQPGYPHRMVDQNRGIVNGIGRIDCIQQTLTPLQCAFRTDPSRRCLDVPAMTPSPRSISSFVQARKPYNERGY